MAIRRRYLIVRVLSKCFGGHCFWWRKVSDCLNVQLEVWFFPLYVHKNDFDFTLWWASCIVRKEIYQSPIWSTPVCRETCKHRAAPQGISSSVSWGVRRFLKHYLLRKGNHISQFDSKYCVCWCISKWLKRHYWRYCTTGSYAHWNSTNIFRKNNHSSSCNFTNAAHI